jgi:hypothetical protein
MDVAAQRVLDGDALEVVGWLYQGIKIQLLGHGNGDGRSRREDELCHDMGGDEAG